MKYSPQYRPRTKDKYRSPGQSAGGGISISDYRASRERARQDRDRTQYEAPERPQLAPVRSGDTYASLADKLKVPVGKLAKENNSQDLNAGTYISVPGKASSPVVPPKPSTPPITTGGLSQPADPRAASLGSAEEAKRTYQGSSVGDLSQAALGAQSFSEGAQWWEAAGERQAQLDRERKVDIWEGHNYWEGHLDPYRFALNLAGDQASQLAPHPSENLDAYRYSTDMASDYLTDMREWENSIYEGGVRPDLVTMIKEDPLVLENALSGNLTTGDMLEFHREFPAWEAEFGEFMITSQLDVDILTALGYLAPDGYGYGRSAGAYEPEEYEREPASGTAPRNTGQQMTRISLTSWRI